MDITVTELYVYPVKSLRGIALSAARLTHRGLDHDRHWLVIDGQGRFLSQRRVPAMARIRTALEDDTLILRHDEAGECAVPRGAVAGDPLETEVWGDRCKVVDQGDDVAAWLTSALGAGLGPRLVCMAPDFERRQSRPERYGPRAHTRFADTAPFLITATGSLAALNEALEDAGHAAVPMDRFRPNIVVDGLPAFRERSVAALEGPGYRLGLRHPRERCVITTLDQATGERDPDGEPFRTLQRINPMPVQPGTGKAGGPAFGELSVLEDGDGRPIRVGDRLEEAL